MWKTLKLKRGIKQNLPMLQEGEPAFTTDDKELYIGTQTGNVKITSTKDMEVVKEKMTEVTDEFEGIRTQFDDAIANVTVDSEVITARTSSNTAKVFPVIGSRFDALELDVADKVSLSPDALVVGNGFTPTFGSAAQTGVADVKHHFVGDNVEGILQEVGDKLVKTTADLAEIATEMDVIVTGIDNYYVKCLSTDTGALLIVTSGAIVGQINLASVSPRMSTYTPVVGDYVTKASNLLTAEMVLARASVAKGKTFPTVGGRLEELDADTYFPMFNLITNGDFNNGTTGWETYASSKSVSANELTAAITSIGTFRIEQLQDVAIAGHEYYVRCEIYPKYANSAQFQIGGVNGATLYPVANVWNTLSGIITANATTRFRFYHNVTSSYVIGDAVKFRRCLVLDLTEIFGTGNKPNPAQIESMLSFYTNSWFNGKVNLAKSTKLLPYILNDLRSKANIVQEAWITPTLLNGWGAFDTRTAKYKKSTFSRVYLKGIVKNGTIGSTIFTLPVGYRPDETLTYAIPSNGLFGYVTINIDGTVVCTLGSNVSVSLNGVNFYV